MRGQLRWKPWERSLDRHSNLERSPPVPGYEALSRNETFVQVTESEARLRVLEKLRGFSVAAEKIITEKGQGSFHLVVLNSVDKSVSIRPYGLTRLEQAKEAYIEAAKRPPSFRVGSRRRPLAPRTPSGGA